LSRVLAHLLPVATLALSMSGSPAGANGVVRGRVEWRQEPSRLDRRPTVAEHGMPTPREPQDRRRSVVYLETAPRAAFERPREGRAIMDQRNETFVPRLLAIMAGTTVDFPNSDVIFHNVFSLSRTKPFDLGRYAAGRSKSVRFDHPGIVRVFCEIHSHMSAYILVFAHPYYSVTDPEGRFRLDNVPPGTYTVTVWNETVPRDSREVRVPDEGGDVEVNFRLGRGSD
jgi:plastocyanin